MYRLYFSQKLPIDLVQAWNFFSSPLNLEAITPQNLALKIKSKPSEKKLYSGQIIFYSFVPFWPLSMEWVTEITVVQEQEYFIDEQKFGPFTFWHHEHWFTEISNGTLVEDIIYYKMPLGVIGKALHALKVKGDLEKIFLHRSQALANFFGTSTLRLEKK